MTDDAQDLSFEQDLAKARSGDRPALDRLLGRLQERLLKEADRRMGDRLRGKTRASDVLQDAYLEVIRGIGRFEGRTEASFYAWVTAILESSARQQHRFLTTQRRHAPSRTSQLQALARELLPSSRSPATDLENAEAAASVLQALESLREDHRVAIEQILLRGRPVPEVADDLGRSEAATRMLLSRARAELQQAIEKLKA